MLSIRALARVQRLITFRDLHATVPVPIDDLILDEGWQIRYASHLHPLYGYAIIRARSKLMRIAADITPAAQRYVKAHEFAHDLNGDQGLSLCSEWEWLWRKQELAADEIAAHLLIPDWTLSEYETIAELAIACEVPERLVEVRLKKGL